MLLLLEEFPLRKGRNREKKPTPPRKAEEALGVFAPSSPESGRAGSVGPFFKPEDGLRFGSSVRLLGAWGALKRGEFETSNDGGKSAHGVERLRSSDPYKGKQVS